MADSALEKQHYFAIGLIVGVHGIRGEVKVSPMTDFPERFRPGAKVYLGSSDAATPTEQKNTLYVIETARPHKENILIKFKSVPDRNAAELLRDQYLLIPEAEAMPLGANENYVHDLIGLAVETVDGRPLGRLVEVLFTKANDVYVARGPDGEVLLPALQSVVLNVDLAVGKMVVALPDGLLD